MINYLNPNYSITPAHSSINQKYEIDISVAKEHIDVSIITPFFNTEEFFMDTFASIQSQSLQNWEWIIVDDGSTDSQSLQHLESIVLKDARVKVIHQVNLGPSVARNTSFRNSTGRYVCLLDSDDMLEPTYLEKCVWFLDSNQEFSFCNAYSIFFGDDEFLWTNGYERGKDYLKANSGPPISVIRRQAYIDSGGFDESITFSHEDWDFWLAMAKAGHWGYTIHEFLQWYRKRVNGRFEQIMKTDRVNDEFEKLMQRKYADLEKNFPDPKRRHIIPYESINTDILVNNLLAENPSGRRIMFLIPWMVTGGADRVNLDLIEGLTAKGHDVTICATLATDHRWEHEFSKFTTDIFVLPNFLHVSDYPRFLAYMIKSRKIDTVLITGCTLGYQFLPYLRAIAPQVAFVDMSHVEELHWLNGGHPRFGNGYQDMLDINITTTQNLADWMVGRGADSDRIKVMYTGVRVPKSNDKARENIRKEFGIDADVPIIVFAGRICAQKQPILLAEILKGVRDKGILFKALIIGDGELKHQFERALVDHQLMDHVQMLGSVAHQRWLDILPACDILLMPSQYEGISIALLEAIASGVVPVVAKVGGQSEIVSGDEGVLISHSENELQDYIEAIYKILSNSSLLHQMSNQCKRLGESKLSWARMIDSFLEILDDAHQFRASTPRVNVPEQFALELASQSIECKRLGDAVDWLYKANSNNNATSIESLTTSKETQAVARVAIILSQTWLGQKLITNQYVHAIGRYFHRRYAR